MPALTSPSPSQVIANALTAIQSSKEMSRGIRAVRSRASSFHNSLEMDLAGIAMVPEARAMLRSRLASYWKRNAGILPNTRKMGELPDIIIGGGVHAAIYAAIRVLTGHPKPIVLEKFRVGGVFSATMAHAWFLNQRNWPGTPGQPDEPYSGSLAHIPGAPVQLSHITAAEYPTNADLSFIIEVTLAMYAEVITGVKVTDVALSYEGCSSVCTDVGIIYGSRVIDARGIGFPKKPATSSPNDMNFLEFMSLMDKPFPLEGMRRVAVEGDGESAICVVESLMGIGPSMGFSTPELDFPDHVDMYSPNFPTSRRGWRRDMRGRYLRAGSYLYRDPGENDLKRVRVYSSRGKVTPSLDGVIVNGRNYSHSIQATGWNAHENIFSEFDTSSLYPNPLSPIARKYGAGRNLFAIGPRADIPWTDDEYSRGKLVDLPQQRVSLWRLGPLTAALAMDLP